MNEDIFNKLNEIYKPLCEKTTEIKNKLNELGFCVKSGFYNNHYVKCDNGFLTEHFPIPVISVENIGDIGIDINSIWIEIILSRDEAILLDYAHMAHIYNFEVYGVNEYLHDFYNAQSDPRLVVEKINNSEEKQICVAFYYAHESNTDELISIVRLFAK